MSSKMTGRRWWVEGEYAYRQGPCPPNPPRAATALTTFLCPFVPQGLVFGGRDTLLTVALHFLDFTRQLSRR